MYRRFAASACGIGNNINKTRPALMLNDAAAAMKFGIKTKPLMVNDAALKFGRKDLHSPRTLNASFPTLQNCFEPRATCLRPQASTTFGLNRNYATLIHRLFPPLNPDFVRKDGGVLFPTGFISSRFANSEDETCVLINPLVVIFEDEFDIMSVLMDFLRIAHQKKRPLLIVGTIGIREHATLVYNKLYGQMKVCAIDAHSFGWDRTSIMHDLAVLTGGQVIDWSHDSQCVEEYLHDANFGSCGKVIVTELDTIVYNGHGRRVHIMKRCDQIKSAIALSFKSDEKEKLQERLARLSAAVCHLEVGPNETKYGIDSVSKGIAIGEGVHSLFASKDSANLLQNLTKRSFQTIALNAECAGSREFNDLNEEFHNDDGYGDISSEVANDGPPYNPCEPCAGSGKLSPWELCDLDCDFTKEGWRRGTGRGRSYNSDDESNDEWQSDDDNEDKWRLV